MAVTLKVLGYTMRVFALVWMISIVSSVVGAVEGFTSIGLILPGIAFHAVMAVGGVQLCGVAKRMKLKKVAAAQVQAA